MGRRARKRIYRASDALLDEFEYDDLFGNSSKLSAPVAELGYELDSIQAMLAGSETWRRNPKGLEWRDEIRHRLYQLLDTAVTLDMSRTRERIEELSAVLDFPERTR